MSSLPWEERTILTFSADFNFEAQPIFEPSNDGLRDEPSNPKSQRKPRLSAANVWNFLLSLTDNGASGLTAEAGKLKHFQAKDFDNTWDHTVTTLGEGTSYTVEKWTLENPPEKGYSSSEEKAVVAVKRLNTFKSGSSEDSPIDSVTLQYSINTVLKELRILTHPPLQQHRNIATLLGYRSEFVHAATSTEQPQEQQRSTDIALVAEFAQYGTLSEFVAQRGDFDLLTKARFMHDLASGLAALHECGIAHGDVKLDNTLVFEDHFKGYIAKLSDFGHALVDLENDEDNLTIATPEKHQWYLGTPLFNAPEIRPRGTSSNAPARTLMRATGFFKCDIFSYGVLVWELLLNGIRFTSSFDIEGSSVATTGGFDQDLDKLWNFLSALPKDEFLRKALSCLEAGISHGKDEGALVGTLRQVLEVTLRDLPWERKSSEKVVNIFRELKTFRDDDTRSAALSKSTPRLSRLLAPSTELLSAPGEENTNFVEMPPAVQVDLVAQLQSLTTAANEGSVILRRNAMYDLAMCYMTGFGNNAPDANKACDLLLEAAQLGSQKALNIIFRLHLTLRGVAPELSFGDSVVHPIIEVEKHLTSLPPQKYFSERVRQFEKVFQQEALRQQYDILHKGQLILTGISLYDVDDLLATMQGTQFFLESLECSSQSGELDLPPVRGLLLHTAVRFGLLSLVRFLLGLAKPLSRETHLSVISSPKQEDLLIAACRGGQLVMLEYLLSEGVELSFQMLGTPLHWLIMFPIDEAKKALDILLTTEIGKACLLIEVPSPRVKMQHFYLTGTPLEWAITVNYKELVELLLAVEFDPKLEKDLPALGWTDSTFRRAVASHLSDLIIILLPLELAYLESRPLFDAGARYLLSHGESKHLPFGLFDLSHSPNSPLFIALMHGSSSRAAVDASIETILRADICEIDSIDSKALTALAHAVRFAPCTLNTDVISSLISHGATFGNRRPASIILELVAKRSDCVEGPIISLLLESGVLPLTIKVVTAAVQTGNVRILEALLSFVDTSGKKFDVSVPVVEDGLSASLLFFALISPNHAQTMSLLLDYGADIESQMSNKTILETAISLPGCDGEAINMLISRGASLTFLDGFTLIHRAAALKSQVDRLHILYHILKNEKAAEFVNVPVKVSNGSYTKLVWPLQIACLTGNVEAVRALLSADAKTEVDESSSVLDLAISIGRRPELSPRSDIDLNDEKMVYSWRLNIEEIVMMLLDKTAPGHGRTPLHVAAHLGNYDRIVELVERKGLKVTTMDQSSLRPLDLLEDVAPLENGTETSQSHIENLKRIKIYLSERFTRDVNLTPWGEKRMEELLEEISTTTLESAEDIAAKAGFEKTLREMKVDKDQAYLSTLTDGCNSPSEVEAICSELLAEKKQDQDLADADLRILRIMEVLFRAYYMQRKYEEAEKIQYDVLIAREAQLNEDDSLLHFTRSDRCRILCVLGRNEEALAYTNDAIIKALYVFGINNLATLSLQCGLSIIEGKKGNYDKAIELQEKALSVLDERGFKDWKSKRSLWFGTIEVMCNLIFYSCKAEVLDAVNELAEKSASAFEFVLKEEFLQAFELLDHAAMTLQLNKRFEDAEVIYTKAAEICTKNHGRGKSYCVRNALERLSGLYIVQQKWKDAAIVLQQLLNHFTIILDQDHPDKVKCTLRLAIALEKEERYLEASLLQEQAVRSLEQTLGITDPQTLQGKLGLCRNYRRTNQLDKSEIMGRLAMNGFRNLSGEDDQWTLSAENELATTLLEENKLKEALEIRQRQVSAMELVHGEVHEKTQNALLLLSQTLMRMDRVEEVLEQSERALQICLKIWGQNSHPLSNCLYIQAQCKKKLEDGEEAAKLFARSLEAERVSHGGNNSETLLTMRVLGKLYSELEEYEKAESLFRELLDEAPKVYGTNDHAEIQLATNYLGYVCEMTDRLDEAIKHYQEAAQMARQIHGDSNGETVACLDDLLRAYMDADRMRAARTLAVEVLQWKIKNLGKHHEDTMDTYKAFCIIYPELDMWPEAERVQRLVLRHLQSQSQDADEAEIISTMAAVADSCQHQDRYKEAERFARQVLKLNIQRNGKEAEETLQAMIRLAYTLADSNQVTEAEKLNNDAYSISLRVFDSEHEQAISALSQSAYICYKQEKFEEAEKIQLQVLDLDPDDVTEIEFLQNVYTKMKRFDEALELCQKEISIRQEVWGDEGLDCISILRAMGNMTNLYASLERWDEARENGERVQGSIKKIQIPRNFLHDKVFLDSMTALKPVYEALCEEDKLHELTFQIKIEEDNQNDRRKRNAKILENDLRSFGESIDAGQD